MLNKTLKTYRNQNNVKIVVGIRIWFPGEEEKNRLNDQFNNLLMTTEYL